MDKTTQSVLIFDIGKTHVKVTLLSLSGEKIYQNRTSNRVKETRPYRSYDVDHIWAWLLKEITKLAKNHTIKFISIATHGAAAALVNVETETLLLPIMDYEFEDYPNHLSDYKALRPGFHITGSPEFPAGLNLGRQLHWQSQILSDSDRQSATLLMYPQYWAWRLTGKICTEVTSLGCHTDIWDIHNNAPTSLMKTLGLDKALPSIMPAWETLGPIKETLAEALGLNPNCKILPGVHDSNAGYLPILKTAKKERPTVVSSGTWSVVMDSEASLIKLDKSKDMLVNIDAEGTPLATARYMGGREFGLICERLDTDITTTFTDKDIQEIIESNTFILPSFCIGTGPYPNKEGQIVFDGEKIDVNGKAAATIYSALMLNDILKRLDQDTHRDILIEGSFAKNSVLCALIAKLNPSRKVRIESQGNGVTKGCFLLTFWNEALPSSINPEVQPYPYDPFLDYAKRWENKLNFMAEST